MKFDLSRHAPVGFEVQTEKDVFVAGMILSAIYSLRFFWEYSDDEWLIYTSGSKEIVRPGSTMTSFAELIDGCLMGFGIVAAVMIAFIVWHYVYHTQESRSIYLMRRLPNRWELHRRCLTLPVVGMAICGLAAFGFLMLYYVFYMTATPAECIAPGQWELLWRELL